jgi:hypothetical protein
LNKINVSGFSHQQRKVRSAAERVAKHLGLTVDINVRKLKETRSDKYAFAYYFMGNHGVCVFEDCPDDMLPLVISHELVHVHQVSRGDMVFDHESQTFYWKGEKYDLEKLNTISYYDRPWEAEAKGLEKDLAKIYINKNI